MREVEMLEARDKLGALLDLAEGGQEVRITRDGREVVRLVPARQPRGADAAAAALRRIRARAEGSTLGRFDWEEWKSFRDEGRA